MTILKNNKGIAPIFIFLIIGLILIAVYLFLLIPIPAFTKIRGIINFVIIVFLWFLVQGLIIYGYFRLGKLAMVGYGYYRRGIYRIVRKTKSLFDSSF